MSIAYRVIGGTQVHAAGVTYGEGESVPADVPSADLALWLNAGWIEPVAPKTRKPAKAS